jgi:hypothetical protein
MDLLRYRQQVARGLNAVEASLALLVNALAHSAVSIEAEPTADEESPIRRVCEAYSTINYRMDDEVGLSVVCLGVIGANAEILRLAEAVNRAKANFIVVCAPLQDIFTRIPVKDETSPTRSVPLIRVILRNLQRSDLNLLAAYRNIPILGAPPASVTYTRANTRAVYRKSLEEIDELLQNREGPAATADRQRLETLDRRESCPCCTPRTVALCPRKFDFQQAGTQRIRRARDNQDLNQSHLCTRFPSIGMHGWLINKAAGLHATLVS